MTLSLPFRKKATKPAAVIFHNPDEEDEEIRYRAIDRKLVLRTLRLLLPYKKRYALGISLGILMTIAEMMSPKFTQWIINYGANYATGVLSPMPATPRAAIWHIVFLVSLWAVVLTTAV